MTALHRLSRSHGTARRDLLRAIAMIVAAPAAIGLASLHRPAFGQTAADVARAPRSETGMLLKHAFEMGRRAEASGDQPYGAIIVRDGTIVGEAPSRVVVNGDPTAHAEMEAIRDACRRLATRSLAGCEMYSSSRPCRMCEAGAYWAGIGRMIHGMDGTDAGAPRPAGC